MEVAVAAVVPAKDESARLAATIAALFSLEQVEVVVVVDDGSTDDTHLVAARAGAIVVRHPRNRGKAAALETGVARLAEEERRTGADPHLLLFADADLESSAARLGALVGPVARAEADLALANLPSSASSRGGGRVVRLAQRQILAMTGVQVHQPLNGMRCLTREAFGIAQPLAPGWGVEAAMLVDILRAGGRVVEVPVEISHRRTGADWRGRAHRARQLRDVARALLLRRLR